MGRLRRYGLCGKWGINTLVATTCGFAVERDIAAREAEADSLDSTRLQTDIPPPADGDMDLYVGNYNAANKLYRNEGDGTFSDVSSIAGVADSGYGYGVAWGDYDGTVSGV